MQDIFGSAYSVFVDTQPNAAAALNADSVVTLTQAQHDDLLLAAKEYRRLNALIKNPIQMNFCLLCALRLRISGIDLATRTIVARALKTGSGLLAIWLANWYEAINRDESGNCRGEDLDIKLA